MRPQFTNAGVKKSSGSTNAWTKGLNVMSPLLNPFPNTSFWDHPKFKEAADDNWNVAI